MKPFIIPLFIPHRGCPFQCIYCDQRITTGPDPENEICEGHGASRANSETEKSRLEETVHQWLEQKKCLPPPSHIQIAFYGGSFTSLSMAEQTRLLTIASPFLMSNAVDSLRISARPDYCSEENLKLLRKFGVKTIELGVQSMDNEVLRLSKRGYKPETVHQTAAKVREFGFELGIQLMPGLPDDNREKFIQTVEKAVSMQPHCARLYPAVVIQGTPLADNFRKGIYKPLLLEEAVDWCAAGASRLRKAGVKVIRMGLQPTENIRMGGKVVAGPFHPAFGQLVESRIALEKMSAMFLNFQESDIRKQTVPENNRFVFHVPFRELSNYRGQRNGNLAKLEESFKRKFVILSDTNLGEGKIKMEQTSH